MSTKSVANIIGLEQRERRHFKPTRNLSKTLRWGKRSERKRQRREEKEIVMGGEQAEAILEDMMLADEEEDDYTGLSKGPKKPYGPGDCPRCGGPTHLVKDGRYGSFWGCNFFPRCTGSRSLQS